jgi:hypothetical protein
MRVMVLFSMGFMVLLVIVALVGGTFLVRVARKHAFRVDPWRSALTYRPVLFLIVALVGAALLVRAARKHAPAPAVEPRVATVKSEKSRKSRITRVHAAPPAGRVAEIEPGIAVENPPPPHGIAWQVKGWGRYQAEAEADAVARATKGLADFLQDLNPPLLDPPPQSYVRGRLVRGAAQRLQDLDQVIDKAPEAIKMECWSLNLVVTPEDYAELARREKEIHIERERSHRMLWSAWILGGVLILLAGIIGLMRLREWANALPRTWCPRSAAKGAKVKALVVACVVVGAVVGFLFLA